MHQVTIFLGIQSVILLYRDAEKATKVFDQIDAMQGILRVEDDFGHCFVIKHEAWGGVMLEDLTQSQLGHVEHGLHNARTQAKAQQAASRDPALQAARMAASQGPAVLQPMNGRF